LMLEERRAKADELRNNLLAELEELKQNSSCALVGEVDALISRVRG